MNLSDIIDIIDFFREFTFRFPKIYRKPLTIFNVSIILFVFFTTYIRHNRKIQVIFLAILTFSAIYTFCIFLCILLSVRSFKRQVNEKKKETTNLVELWKVYKGAQITKFFLKQTYY